MFPLPFHLCLSRFVNVLVYYGLSLNISDFGMSIYLTQLIFRLVEMPARTITLFTLNHSRRVSQIAFLAVGGLACLLTVFIPDGTELSRGNSAAFNVPFEVLFISILRYMISYSIPLALKILQLTE